MRRTGRRVRVAARLRGSCRDPGRVPAAVSGEESVGGRWAPCARCVAVGGRRRGVVGRAGSGRGAAESRGGAGGGRGGGGGGGRGGWVGAERGGGGGGGYRGGVVMPAWSP